MNKHQKLTMKQLKPATQLQIIQFFKSSQAQQGVTLIELMVALVIGLVVSLAVYSVLNASEGRKRSTTSINDIDQAGSFAAYQIDKALRSSGSGFTGGLYASRGTKAADYSFACRLRVRKNAATLLPNASPFEVPFSGVSQVVTLAPIVILDGAATDGTTSHGDVLISMSGSGGLSESITNLTSTPKAAALTVSSKASLSAKDIILVTGASATDGAPTPGQICVLDQIEPSFLPSTGSTDDVALSGDYHDNTGAITAFSATSAVLNLGKNPSFNMFAVGKNNVLFKYDLLQPAAAATADSPNPSEFVDSVFQMEAIYGITNTAGATGNFAWQAPTGLYAGNALMGGTAVANSTLQTITAVRVALVMRTALAEKTDVSSSSITVFNGTGLEKTIDKLDTHYRYRVIETTIPLRNTLATLAK